jgi:hypothetical protein
VNGISKWVEYRSKIWVNVMWMDPNVRFGDNNEFSESAVSVDTYAGGSDTHLPAPCPTIATVPADDVPFTRYASADLHITYLRPNFDDFAVELVPRNHWRLDGFSGPWIP